MGEKSTESAHWTAGELKWESIASAEGIAPLGTLAEIARGTPEDAEELLEVVCISREMDLAAQRRTR